jgi:hypothetical protein
MTPRGRFAATLLAAAIGVATVPAGAQSTVAHEMPSWLRERIERYAKAPLGTAPNSIWKYDVQGESVYLISAPPGGVSDQLLDARGRYICSMRGPVAGKDERVCTPSFSAPARMLQVWKDPRLGLTQKPEDTTR